MASKTASAPPADGLVGRCFVHFNPDRTVQHQGIVRAKITEEVYLVQYFDAFAGEPSTLELLPLKIMLGDGNNRRQAGAYEFFQNSEHLIHWMTYTYREPKDRHVGPEFVMSLTEVE